MTPEERADARDITRYVHGGAGPNCICGACRLDRYMIAALNALEAAEQENARLAEVALERDKARQELALYHDWPEIRARINHANEERDTARAQVAMLAEALRWYADAAASMVLVDSVEHDHGARARAALKAAGIET